MKKALVVLLALALVLSMAGTAFASVSDNNGNFKGKGKNKGGLLVNTGNISKIKQEAAIVNVAKAKSGDANATGNYSMTWVKSDAKADSKDKKDAKNDGKVEVKNEGWAVATSGDATAKNTGDNKIEQKADVEQKAEYDIKVKLGFPRVVLPPVNAD